MTTQLFDELTVRCPESRSAVATAGHDRIAVRTETHTCNRVLVATELKLHLPGFDVPNSRRVIAGRQGAELSAWGTFGREQLPIRTKRERRLCAGQTSQHFSSVTIKTPDHRFLIGGFGREVVLIGTKHDLADSRRVASQNLDRFAR